MVRHEVDKGGSVLLIIVIAIVGTLLLIPAFSVIMFLGWTPSVPAAAAVENDVEAGRSPSERETERD